MRKRGRILEKLTFIHEPIKLCHYIAHPNHQPHDPIKLCREMRLSKAVEASTFLAPDSRHSGHALSLPHTTTHSLTHSLTPLLPLSACLPCTQQLCRPRSFAHARLHSCHRAWQRRLLPPAPPRPAPRAPALYAPSSAASVPPPPGAIHENVRVGKYATKSNPTNKLWPSSSLCFSSPCQRSPDTFVHNHLRSQPPTSVHDGKFLCQAFRPRHGEKNPYAGS